MHGYLLVHDGSRWLTFDLGDWGDNLGLHHVLGEVVPHVVLPAALDGLALLRQILWPLVLDWTPAKL